MPVKRTVRRKPQKGKGIPQDIYNFVKSQKLISKGLSLIPHPLAQGGSLLASQLGFGKANMAHHPQMGGGFFSDLGGGIGNIFGGLGGGLGSVAHGLFGGHKQRPRRLRNVVKV